MKKSALLIIATTLVGMSPPGSTPAGSSGDEMAGGYPPCSKTVTDRCIQLYERGVNTPANLALNRSMGARATAMGGPYEPSGWSPPQRSSNWSAPAPRNGWSRAERRSGYPPCSRSRSDDRCIQLYERGVSGVGN